MEPKASKHRCALPVRRGLARARETYSVREQVQRNVTSSTHRNENIVPRILPYRYHACIAFPGNEDPRCARMNTHRSARAYEITVRSLRVTATVASAKFRPNVAKFASDVETSVKACTFERTFNYLIRHRERELV